MVMRSLLVLKLSNFIRRKWRRRVANRLRYHGVLGAA
jgi:hypothetical protein